MNAKDYAMLWTADMLMGPNSARILEALLERFPTQLNKGHTILDLGCGKGLTSLMLARETGAKVYANDLWIKAEDNAKRFESWGMAEQILPVHEDANELHFEKKQFDALFSIDSYHYFAGEKGFFAQKILPFLADGAGVWIGVPGIQNEFTGRSEELLSAWLGEEAYMFKSADAWKDIIGSDERIQTVETWEMDCFDAAWEEWFATGNPYAEGDRQHFESLIRPYTCFVGIYIQIK